MIPDQQMLDKLTRQDELLAMMVPILQQIRDRPAASSQPPPPYPPSLPGMPPHPTDLSELIRVLKAQQVTDQNPFTLTFPRDGTRLTVAAGTTIFDFQAGTVAAPGVAIVDMGNSLMMQRREFMRALMLNVNTDAVVKIESADKMPIRAGSFPLFPYRQFKTVEVTVSEESEVLISASTSAAAIVSMGGELSPSTHSFTGAVYENEHTICDSDGMDISTAAYLQEFAVTETSPNGIFFKPDGTKMYVTTIVLNVVREYDLSAAWDVTTAVYLQNFAIAEATVKGIFFKPDGTKMYVVALEGEVKGYTLTTPWDVTTAGSLVTFSVSAQGPSPHGIFFKPDGTKMYIADVEDSDINRYNLSTAWDISTAAYSQTKCTTERYPYYVYFAADGLKMYVMDTADTLREYDLSAAWDVTTAVYLQEFAITEDSNPNGIFFSPDGAKLYVVGSSNEVIYEYDLDSSYRFETAELLLRDVIIRIRDQDALVGDSSNQRYPKSADSACGFTSVNLEGLCFQNATVGNNTKINILGVRL